MSTSPAPTTAVTAKKPAPKKPKKPNKPATTVARPRTPLEAAGVEIEKQKSRLQRREGYIKGITQALPILQKVQREEPDLIDLLLKSLTVHRDSPPDGAAKKAALEIVTTNILDRIDAAFASGRFREISAAGLEELFGPGSGIDQLTVFAGDFYELLHLVDPAQYPIALTRPRPTATAPGSPSRVEEYARRREREEELHADGDANHLTDAVIKARANGMGQKVLGRESELAEEDQETSTD